MNNGMSFWSILFPVGEDTNLGEMSFWSILFPVGEDTNQGEKEALK